MAVTVVDTQNTVDSAGVANRDLTKPNAANLQPGDWTVIFASGNLAGPPVLATLPPGFTQPNARITDGTDTYLDVLVRKWDDAAEISGLASETWTTIYAGTHKGQFPTITLRGISPLATTPFSAISGTAETGTAVTSHTTGSITVPAGDALLVTVFDRFTGGVTYTQAGSDTELINSIGPGTNAITQGVWFNGSPTTGSNSRTYNFTPVAADKAIMYITSIAATIQPNPPMDYRVWNGSSWVLNNRAKVWNGSTWVSVKVKAYV